MRIVKRKKEKEFVPSQPYTKGTLVVQIIMSLAALLFLSLIHI